MGREGGDKKEKKLGPKKQARKKGAEKRENQPASEDYGRWSAKELEKSKGKDAKRKAHDMKKKALETEQKRR